LKRLKRGREEQSYEKSSKGVDNIFSDDEDITEQAEQEPSSRDNRRRGDDYAEEYDERARYRHRDAYDDMGDFIADEDDDDDLNETLGERSQPRGYDDDRGRRGKANKDMMDILPEGISEEYALYYISKLSCLLIFKL
jgi:transcription elongation factor SPT6